LETPRKRKKKRGGEPLGCPVLHTMLAHRPRIQVGLQKRETTIRELPLEKALEWPSARRPALRLRDLKDVPYYACTQPNVAKVVLDGAVVKKRGTDAKGTLGSLRKKPGWQ